MMKGIALLFSLVLISGPLRAQILEQSFTDSEAGFKISTPGGQWAFVPRGIDPGPVRLTIRYEAPVHQFVPNVTVRVQELDEPKTKLEAFLKQDLAALPESVEVVEKKKLPLGGREGYHVLLHDKASRVVFHQRVLVAKGRSYVLTCSAHAESYTRMRKDCQKILESFELL